MSSGHNSSLTMSQQAAVSSFDNTANDDKMEEINESAHFIPLASSSKSFPRDPVKSYDTDMLEETDLEEVVVQNVTATVVTASPTVHQQPNWVQVLKDNFFSEIISPCSHLTVSAVNENLYIQVGSK